PDHPQPDHAEPGHSERTWGGDAAERAWGGDPGHPDDLGCQSAGPGEPPRGDSPAAASGEPQAAESRTGGWPQRGRGSAAGERAWPWTGDPPPLTKEAAERLNAWGDNEPTAAAARGDKVAATAATSPWGDDEASVAPDRGEEATATTGTSPRGDSEDASPGP
ncbi:MAG TPA: hypothetical protein VGD71_36595, partial [Kribbella sp.]